MDFLIMTCVMGLVMFGLMVAICFALVINSRLSQKLFANQEKLQEMLYANDAESYFADRQRRNGQKIQQRIQALMANHQG